MHRTRLRRGPFLLGQIEGFGLQRAIAACLLLRRGDTVGMIVGNRGKARFGGGVAAVAAQHRRRGIDMVEQRSEEHTSELQSLMRISYAVFCLKKKKNK